MAEVAGLALGGVALAGLFSSCIEVLEYLENSKNYARDVQVTLTKLGFLKQRLHAWGTDAFARPLPDFAPKDDFTIQEGTLITQSLHGIHHILKDASVLCTKYGCGRSGVKHQSIYCHPTLNDTHEPNQVWETTFASSRPPQALASLSWEAVSAWKATEKSQPDRVYDMAILRRVRLKIIWVLTDCKRFNSLLADLDILISNLERLTATFPMASRNAKDNDSGIGMASSTSDGEPSTPPQSTPRRPATGDRPLPTRLAARGVRVQQAQLIQDNTTTDDAFISNGRGSQGQPGPDVIKCSASGNSAMLNGVEMTATELIGIYKLHRQEQRFRLGGQGQGQDQDQERERS